MCDAFIWVSVCRLLCTTRQIVVPTDTHFHTLSHLHTLSHFHTLSYTFIHFRTLSHFHTLSYTFTHTHALTHTHTHFHTQTHFHTRAHARQLHAHTYHVHVSLHTRIAQTIPTFTLTGVYYARCSTPSTHVSSQYSTLPPLMLPVLLRQGPRRQSAQRHHSCQSGQHGQADLFVRAIV